MNQLIDLSAQIGLPEAKLNPENLEMSYGPEVAIFVKAWNKTLGANSMSQAPLWLSLMLAVDYTDEQGNIVTQPDLTQYRDPDAVLYCGQQGLYWNNPELLDQLASHKLRPDVTVLPSGTIGQEFIRTEGHDHLSNLPEVYETNYGQNGFLLFKIKDNSEEIEDVMFVFAKAGDHTIFMPKYQHISLNLGDTPFVMTDWVSTEAQSNFEFIKHHNGAPYWVVKGQGGQPQFILNPRYKGKVPPIRLLRPAPEIPEFGLKKGEPMFNIVKEGKIELLNFLNDTNESGKYDEIYQRAYVPV